MVPRSVDPREALRELLARDGVLRSTAEHPIRHRDGSVAPWMFYSWNVSMTGVGLGLAARVLLDRVGTFGSTQLAAHGLTGLPLLAACIALGDGRFTGLAIRKERKNYLSGRRIEGPGDPSRPVVLLDDSISSGTAVSDGIRALEAEGFEVEGVIALVGFPGRGGIEWASNLGYRAEAIFDISADLGLPLHSRPAFPARPALDAAVVLPNGLAPSVLARRVAEHWLTGSTRPGAPEHLDDEYDGRGGVFVSFRRVSDDARLARDGFWHLPEDAEVPAEAAADVVDATIRTLQTAARTITLAALPDLKIAVTFMGPAEAVAPAELDYRRYAIVCSDRTGARRGGALPNTQVFSHEVQQYRHALTTNARIASNEAHTLYRQTVRKVVEPGASLLSYGAPDGPELAWSHDPEFGRRATDRARAAVGLTAEGPAPPDPGCSFFGVAVTLYRNRTLGVGVAWGTSGLPDLVTAAAGRAHANAGGGLAADTAVVVTVLFDEERFGGNLALAAMKVRCGLDALRCDSGGPPRVALPGAAVYNGWTKTQLVEAVSGGADRPALRTYRTVAWLHSTAGVHRLEFGFPARPAVDEAGDPWQQLRCAAEFTLRHLSRRAVPAYALNAVTGESTRDGTAPRLLHALCGLYRAGMILNETQWCDAALRGVDTYLTGRSDGPPDFAVDRGGPLADAVLFAIFGGIDAPLHDDPRMRDVGRRLRDTVRATGTVSARTVRLADPQDAIFFPGAAVAALAADPLLVESIPTAVWPRVLSAQRARFRALNSWGVVSWSSQGWAAMHECTRDPRYAAFVFELADWAVDRQVAATGAYLEDLSPSEPSFNTGFVAEGIAAAWALGLRVADADRAARYAHSWSRANSFMRRLQVLPGDEFVQADPVAAAGGVRMVASGPWIRADSVSHWLNALCTGLECRRRAG